MTIKDMAPFIKLIKGKDPKAMVESMAANNKIKDPVILQLINYAQTGDTTNFENLATNFFNQQGASLEEFQSFIDLLK